MSRKQQRRTFSAAQKVAIVKRHLIDGVAVSDLCEEHQIQPTLFYQWQKQLFENGSAAFERKGKPKRGSTEQRRIERLEAKLATKNEVIAELMHSKGLSKLEELYLVDTQITDAGVKKLQEALPDCMIIH